MTLESPNGVRFAVHSDRLAARSQVFRDMLEISTPSHEPIQMTEPVAVIELLLAVIYGQAGLNTLDPGNFKISWMCYVAAHKYQLDSTAKDLFGSLVWCVSTPLAHF